MKIMVLSDTHGNRNAVLNIIKNIDEQRPDALVHLGDGAGDVNAIEKGAGMPVYAVSGNCDTFTAFPELLTPSFGGIKFMLCHGHRYRVKSGLGILERAAEQLGCKAVLFGHTHVPVIQQRENVLLLNPGAAGGFLGSYGLVKIHDTGQVSAEILSFDHEMRPRRGWLYGK
ncbi:MAG: metallophosphoesterase family protein [Christensenellales bacterium]|jgi:putative phosphoesterase